MLSKKQLQAIRALESKKKRDERNLFVVEGHKAVSDMLETLECECLVATQSWIDENGRGNALSSNEICVADEADMRRATFLKTPPDVLAIFRKPFYSIDAADPSAQLVLALDGVQDPGNVGTIVRIADWFGVHNLVCSPDTADVYSPKTVQASMGSLAHVQVHYASLTDYLARWESAPVYGTFLNGENIYGRPLSQNGIIVMGNEGCGIRPEIEALIGEKLYIPPYMPAACKADAPSTIDSLNVAIATAIVCAEFRRR